MGKEQSTSDLSGARKRRGRLFLQPVQDYFGLIDGIASGHAGVWLSLAVGVVMGWWLYVPIHELLHAWGCMLTGGTVSQLEIAQIYGGEILAQWFPWVSPGSDYAGQLTGFDTQGNDWIYLATVLAPYLLTLFPGVWLVRRFSAPGRPLPGYFSGLGLSAALAPFISLSGDMYEAGSILITALLGMLTLINDPEQYRSDDLFLLIETLSAQGTTIVGWIIVLGGAICGLMLAFVMYALGGWIADRLLAKKVIQL